MMQLPSILFVLPWQLTALEGVDQVVINLAREVREHGQLRPIILCSDPQQQRFRVTDFDGIMLVNGLLPLPSSDQNPARHLAGLALRMRHDIAAWRAFLKDQNVAVINAHHAVPAYLLFSLMRALRRTHCRLIYSLHGTDVDAILDAGPSKRAAARWMLRQADQVVCCSESLATRASHALKVPTERMSTVHNGINPVALDQAKHLRYRPQTGAFKDYLINVATFRPGKGQDVLIEAYLQLVREGIKAALVLVGRTTPHLSRLRSQVRRDGLHEHVFFVPDLDHAHTLAAIHNAKLLVQPSHDEPFGLPLLEAAYLRTPIVATSSGGIPEVLGGYYPYLVKAGDVQALARAMDEALFNPTDTERQVRLLKRRIMARFTWQRAYSEYLPLWVGTTQ